MYSTSHVDFYFYMQRKIDLSYMPEKWDQSSEIENTFGEIDSVLRNPN